MNPIDQTYQLNLTGMVGNVLFKINKDEQVLLLFSIGTKLNIILFSTLHYGGLKRALITRWHIFGPVGTEW